MGLGDAPKLILYASVYTLAMLARAKLFAIRQTKSVLEASKTCLNAIKTFYPLPTNKQQQNVSETLRGRQNAINVSFTRHASDHPRFNKKPMFDYRISALALH